MKANRRAVSACVRGTRKPTPRCLIIVLMNFLDALSQGMSAIKGFEDTILSNADPIAYVGVIAALGTALLAALVGLGAVAVV